MLIHWFFFWLDDILFPAYKEHVIEKPLFILGNLRSGTTFLHRLLSRESTTFTSLDHMGYLSNPLCHTKEDHAVRGAAR